MAGRLAIDFGTCNTRAAVWDGASGQAKPLVIPDVSFIKRVTVEEADNTHIIEAPHVPSLISYQGHSVWIGRQVEEKSLNASPATFRWMKRDISNNHPMPRMIGDQRIDNLQAGRDFLLRVLTYAAQAINLDGEEVGFTVPVEGYEHYQKWIGDVCQEAGITRYRLLDEASAAALGYGMQIQDNDAYMVVDFGGGTLDVAVVRMEEEAEGGKHCRVVGKAGADLGGSVIDTWLFQDLLKRCGKTPEDVLGISNLLLTEVEAAKESLSFNDSAEILVSDPDTGAVVGAEYTRKMFERLCEENNLYRNLRKTIKRAMREAENYGIEEEHLKAVLLVGGSSLIPSVRKELRGLFGTELVRYHRPLDAVALGGAAFISGKVALVDKIQHDYSLRFFSQAKGDVDYKVLVKKYTPYPTPKPVKEMTLKATHDNQEVLGINIYEVGSNDSICGGPTSGSSGVVLVFDPNGCARVENKASSSVLRHFWVNQKSPTFIKADPPAKKGEARFPVRFTIDGNKRLCMTVFDNHTGKELMRDYPVIELT